VQLTLTNAGTSITATLTSGSDGLFEFVNLKPGIYKLVATKANFKTSKSHPSTSKPTRCLSRTPIMEVGTLSETVEVMADPVQVEMTSMQLTSTISSKAITDLSSHRP